MNISLSTNNKLGNKTGVNRHALLEIEPMTVGSGKKKELEHMNDRRIKCEHKMQPDVFQWLYSEEVKQRNTLLYQR